MFRIFISYSHDSETHRQSVLSLSDQLREDGLDCFIDQYINGSPAEGWLRWMDEQIEAADFVLVVCTPIYLQRFKGKDRQGGRGVNFEGAIISQVLYDNFQQNTKFIPVIPVIPDDGSLDNVPLILKSGSTFEFGNDYEDLYRVLTNQPRATAKPLGKLKHYSALNINDSNSAIQIHIDRLPTVTGQFFGRKPELKLLDESWVGNDTRIIQFVAAGGTGKTKLLRYWLNNLDDRGNYIIWSFYSQGASENKQVSASPFFIEAFKALKAKKTEFVSEDEKGDHLAELLQQNHCLLVLDGMESLQYAGKGMDGRLKDRALTRLLQALAQHHNSLCIITTRIKVFDIHDRAHVVSHTLDNLEVMDGVKLLISLGIRGTDDELQKAVREYTCHALSLHLLGSALHTYLDGDIRKRDILDELIDDYDQQGRHASRVMQAYQHWLADTPELQLLYLLGLFDHPIETEVLQVLWQAQIDDLTAGIPIKAWKVAIRDLHEKHHLLSRYEGHPDLFDCHPMVREYFGRRLQKYQPEVWKQAHICLYKYYKELPEKVLPDTLEEMQPLLSAVTHGCAAGMYQQVLDEVYWPRIRRGKDHYIINKLGAFSDDLAAIASFFNNNWLAPINHLKNKEKAVLLNWVSFNLRAKKRLNEALEVMQKSLSMFVEQKDWKQAAGVASGFSELYLSLGKVTKAVNLGRDSVKYADQSRDLFQRMISLTTYASALHQAGHFSEALSLFEKATQLQEMRQPLYPYLYSVWGFKYCDLLLDEGWNLKARELAEDSLELMRSDGQLIGLALSELTFGASFMYIGFFKPTVLEHLNEAIANLIKTEEIYLPLGYLTRAIFYRHTQNFSNAHLDLQEVYDIVEPSGMRLYLTDYHLEMARLLLAEKKTKKIQQHLDEASKLVEETGYHRRDVELVELREYIS